MRFKPAVIYRDGVASIQGPGGFTEIRTTERQAWAIAQALGITFENKDGAA